MVVKKINNLSSVKTPQELVALLEDNQAYKGDTLKLFTANDKLTSSVFIFLKVTPLIIVSAFTKSESLVMTVGL